MSDDAVRAARLAAYLDALQAAADAIDRARQLYPDPGLDHAIERLRALAAQSAQRWLMLQSPTHP